MRALLLVAALLAGPSFAKEARTPLRSALDAPDRTGGWALGFMLGDPSGLSLKRYLGRNAWDAYIAFAYGPGVRFGGDWLWNLAVDQHRAFAFDFYAGVGPFIGIFQGPCGPGFFPDRCNGDVYLGGRIPLGAEILLREVPLSFGLEIAPGLAFAPGRGGPFLDFLLAVRLLL